MIEKLTEQQIARMDDYVREWTQIGLCTQPANRKEAEEGIRDAYRLAKLSPPQQIVWCTSPFAMALTRTVANDKFVGASVWASVRDSVRASVRASVWASVGASVRASVWASFGASVGVSVWDSVWASVWDSVRASVWASFGASVYGQHDAHWLAFYAYFRNACGLVTETDALQGLTRVAKAANWWLPHTKFAWVSERHNIVAFDNEQRLHREDGAAVEYPDGWGVFAWHGVRVPAGVILTPQNITVQRIENEANSEIRRVLLERYGQQRYIEDSGIEPVHCDDYGVLYRKPIANDEPLVMVKVRNSTAEVDGAFKDYWLRVPPTVRTAHEAVAWTFGVEKNDYRPKQET